MKPNKLKIVVIWYIPFKAKVNYTVEGNNGKLHDGTKFHTATSINPVSACTE